ncbi:telomere binding protein [Teratosphaeriaceae sp. CCFEE 6253]|nr:telomere binding protein [Teratosphaeriaceae sp. CCFEE 6253]
MDDLLTTLRTVRPAPEEKSAPSLTAVKTTKPEGRQALRTLSQTAKATSDGAVVLAPPDANTEVAKTPEDALRILRSQPDTETLLATLRQISSYNGFDGFYLPAPGPLQAQIVQAVLHETIPTFWTALGPPEQSALLNCLRSATGFNALLARLRTFSASTGGKRPNDGAANSMQIRCLLDVASGLFTGVSFIRDLLIDLHRADSDSVKQSLTARELVSILASGRIIATVAQAEDAARQADNSLPLSTSWLANGMHYAEWLGRNIAAVLCSEFSSAKESLPDLRSQGGQLLIKALNLGYPGALTKGLVTELIEQRGLDRLMLDLPGYAKQQTFIQLLRWLSDLCPTIAAVDAGSSSGMSGDVKAIAAVLAAVTASDQTACAQQLRAILADPALSTSISHPVRRACIAVISTAPCDELQTLLESLMAIFTDRLFIAHAPVLHQESIAQTLLLTAGTLHRSSPMAVLVIARSSSHMQGTSSRLDASGLRARWLGMVVAMAVSRLVDREGSRMDFGTDDVRGEEAMWYRGLVDVQDTVGTLDEFRALLGRQEKAVKAPRRSVTTKPKPVSAANGKPVFGPPRPPAPLAQTEVIGEKITELLDEVSDEEDDDLKSYAKPDSDPEDSDEDATLVNRHKPRAPVYIRDLMAMLRDDKSPDRFQLGMKHAAPLIRRKSGFGREVTDHAEEIMGMLCNLQDPFDMDEFEGLRLQAMIAVLLSDVEVLGPWLSRMVFVEGYSLAQRCVMLSALGLGGRELAGFKGEDDLNPILDETNSVGKRLPARLHDMYTSASAVTTSKRIESASQGLERQLMSPLTLQAADHSTAHLNAVKIRTFSSRLAVERTKRRPAPNQLAKVFATAFFHPLTNRYQQDLAAYGSSSVFASAPVVLVTFLKTLALLYHAAGPATVGLEDIGTEFWDLLLSLRVKAAGQMAVMEAVLFSMLTMLNVYALARRQVEHEYGRRVVMAKEWVEMVFERVGGGAIIGGGGGEEEGKVRTLAAGVLVKMGEVIGEWQKEVFGSAAMG